MSIKEIEYKLQAKGIRKDIISDYILEHKEELLEYETKSAKNIIIKKQNSQEMQEIVLNLRKKGYMDETIKMAIEEI